MTSSLTKSVPSTQLEWKGENGKESSRRLATDRQGWMVTCGFQQELWATQKWREGELLIHLKAQ